MCHLPVLLGHTSGLSNGCQWPQEPHWELASTCTLGRSVPAPGGSSGVSMGISLAVIDRLAGILQRAEQNKWYLSRSETEACSVLTMALSRPDGRRGSGTE